MSSKNKQEIDIKIDPNNLFHEETFTDLKIGRIRKLSPVRIDGTPDKNRKPFFIGETQLAVKDQVLPIQCEIDAMGLAEAVEKYPKAIQEAFDKLLREAEAAKKIQEETKSRIIVPG